ncbi:MAG: PD40 domain-containing protein [Candidatus Zixiibacteriota bacterium]|nr:MAG: PD40 domain-containing protein [candidate division Zixibacteria bacterium]
MKCSLIIAAAFEFALVFSCLGATREWPVLKGDYLGQTPPDSVPVIFAPGMVSVQGRYEYGLAISPDGQEIFYTASRPGDGLMVTRQINGVWTEPEVANLRGDNSWEFEAFYTADGRKVFFSSMGEDRKSRIWFADKDSSGWVKAEILDSPVNSIDVFWATFTADGSMYYTDVNNSKILRSRLTEGEYRETEDTGIPSGAHPFIAPDESFMLFNNDGDIYVAFLREDDSWGEPRLLGDKINSSFMETCPSLSPDGKYIFFSRYNDLEGKSDIYWVSSDIIEQVQQSSSR